MKKIIKCVKEVIASHYYSFKLSRKMKSARKILEELQLEEARQGQSMDMAHLSSSSDRERAIFYIASSQSRIAILRWALSLPDETENDLTVEGLEQTRGEMHREALRAFADFVSRQHECRCNESPEEYRSRNQIRLKRNKNQMKSGKAFGQKR